MHVLDASLAQLIYQMTRPTAHNIRGSFVTALWWCAACMQQTIEHTVIKIARRMHRLGSLRHAEFKIHTHAQAASILQLTSSGTPHQKQLCNSALVVGSLHAANHRAYNYSIDYFTSLVPGVPAAAIKHPRSYCQLD